MPEVIKAALSTPLSISQDAAHAECPADIQYMPPGIHQISASRGGQPVSLTVTVDASTAANLDRFLKERLAHAASGQDDRPFFDFNHEDREAAAWPTEFYWAGDDPLTGGVRASSPREGRPPCRPSRQSQLHVH